MLCPLPRLKGAILQSMMWQDTVLQLNISPLLAGTLSLPFVEKRWPLYLWQDGTLFRRAESPPLLDVDASVGLNSATYLAPILHSHSARAYLYNSRSSSSVSKSVFGTYAVNSNSSFWGLGPSLEIQKICLNWISVVLNCNCFRELESSSGSIEIWRWWINAE